MTPGVWSALLAVVLLTVGVAGCSAENGDDGGSLSVLVDTDMGIDDVRALMFLLESEVVDVRAVTVVGTGLARCPDAAVNAAALLRAFDRADVPVACGRDTPLEGANAAPTAWRDEATSLAGMDLDRSGLADTIGDADALLRNILSEEDDLVILALGPLTNIAPVTADAELAGNVSEIRLMGGAIDVGGNVTSLTNVAAEFNIWIDPTAAQRVLDSDIAVSIVPLDATNSAPINPATLEVFATSTTRSSELLTGFYDANPLEGGVFHWDDLAAATLVDPTLVEFEEMRLAVTTDRQSDVLGRTAAVSTGNGPAVQVAVAADRDRFEQLLFGTIAGSQVTTTSAWVPDATVTFDGEACEYDGLDPIPNNLELEVVNSSAVPGSGVIFGVYAPGTTLQQAAEFATSGSGRPPPWFRLISVAPMPTLTSSVWIVTDLPNDVTILCGVTPASASELAGVRLPT